jgi:hypothetical protein
MVRLCDELALALTVNRPCRVIRVDFGMPAACPVARNLGSAGWPILQVEGIGFGRDSRDQTEASNHAV